MPHPAKRKVVQLAVLTRPSEVRTLGPRVLLYALCDDGTMWTLEDNGTWTQIPEVPQP